jgi:hypothetical protein
LNNFPFASVQSALKWFFGKAWIRPPVGGSALPQIKIQTSTRIDDAQLVFRSFHRIREFLNRLPPKHAYIVINEFIRRGLSQEDLAERLHLAGDRSIRYIRDQAFKRIEKELIEEGIVSISMGEEPIYAREE